LADNQISYYGSKNIWDDSLVSLISNSLYGQGYFSGSTVIVFKNLMVVLFILLFINFFKETIKATTTSIKSNYKKIEKNKLKIKHNESILISNKLSENSKKLILENNKLLINNNELLIKNNEILIANSSSGIDKQNSLSPALFAFGLLLSTIFVIVAQFYVFGTQYVVDRTSLFLYPIIALNIPTLAIFFGQYRQWAGRFVAILFTVFCTWHIVRSTNFTHFQEWWFDRNTLEVIKDMKAEYQKRQNGKPINLHTHCVLQPAFDYYRQEQHLDWLFEPFGWDNHPDTVKVYDFYYDYDDELPVLQSKYDVVKKYDKGEFLLLKRK
jgi:hypothetical protein